MPRRTLWLRLALAAAATLAVLTRQRLWCICDDAYIAFRYLSNADLGRGLAWNRRRTPFRRERAEPPRRPAAASEWSEADPGA